MEKKLISIITPTYNEEGNVRILYKTVKSIMSKHTKYNYEHIFIDNSSEDNTIKILREISNEDKNIKVIINTRNFGQLNSPYYAYLQASGDAIISLVADFQDPPNLINDFIKKWEEGYKIVIGIKRTREENFISRNLRRFYYRFLNKISEIELENDSHGYGLYDREVINIIKNNFHDSNPYFKGILCEVGFEKARVYYTQKKRERGVTKNNFYSLYNIAMLGIVNHSRLPLRIATIFGFFASIFSFLVGVIYFVYKIIKWDSFKLGIAPLIIGAFFLFSLILLFFGILGEYVGAIHSQILQRPLVIEKERINF